MFSKKIFAAIISAVLFTTSFSSFANAGDSGNINTVSAGDTSVTAVSNDNVRKPYFNYFGGTVKKISSSENDSKVVLLQSTDNKEANMIITKNTFVINGNALAVGASATGYYNANAPALMIYPPQYNAEVFVVESKEQIVKVDVFNKDLISSDNFLKLNISEATKVVTTDGKTFTGNLADRKLAVIYRTASKSIPAQTTPVKVVVLPETAFDPAVNPEKVLSMNIVVNGKKISSPSAFVNENGVVMVPLSSISEALGLKSVWNSRTRSIKLGQDISLAIGLDSYVYKNAAPVQLGTAPVIIGGRTYVPLKFFTEVAKVKSAQVTETQIEVNN